MRDGVDPAKAARYASTHTGKRAPSVVPSLARERVPPGRFPIHHSPAAKLTERASAFAKTPSNRRTHETEGVERYAARKPSGHGHHLSHHQSS